MTLSERWDMLTKFKRTVYERCIFLIEPIRSILQELVWYLVRTESSTILQFEADDSSFVHQNALNLLDFGAIVCMMCTTLMLVFLDKRACMLL